MDHRLESLQERLEQEFGGRLRVRWSSQFSNYSIEQKFTKGIHVSGKLARTENDEMIRAREGYLQICSINPSDRMKCEVCQQTIKVPINEFHLMKCPECKARGKDTSHVVGFFDLAGDHIIEHLRKLDPLKGHQMKIRESIAENNRKRYEQLEREKQNQAYSYGMDMAAEVFGIPQVGLSGKTQRWVDAPEMVITNEKQKARVAKEA